MAAAIKHARRNQYNGAGYIDPAVDLEGWINSSPLRQRAAAMPGKRTHSAIRQRTNKLAKYEREYIEDRLRHDRLAAFAGRAAA